jgi:hypothetical protein
MARSSRSFTLATKASVEEKNAEYEPLEIPFIDPDAPLVKNKKPDPRYVVAHFPGEGHLFAIASAMGSQEIDANPAGALRKFLKAALSVEDFRFVWHEIEETRLDVEDDIIPMVAEMLELWSGVPSRQ